MFRVLVPVAVFRVLVPVAVFSVLIPVRPPPVQSVGSIHMPVWVPDIVITLSGPVNVSVAVFPARVFPRVKVLEPPPVLPPPTVLNIGGHPVGEPVKLSVPVCEGKADPVSDESGMIIV